MNKIWLGALGVLGVCLLACGATEEQLRARAAFDMKCSQGELQITEIDDRTRGVRGCGAQATYVENCANGKDNCTWVLNSDSSRADKD